MTNTFIYICTILCNSVLINTFTFVKTLSVSPGHSSKMAFLDKVVIITGAGGGIGRATSKYFYQQMAKLVLVDVNQQALDTTKKEIEKLKGSRTVLYMTTDLTNDAEVRRVISAAVDQFGRIDVLINNAAISSKDSIMENGFMNHYEKTFAVNLFAPMLLTHLAVPYLIESKGNVVNITSVGGVQPLPNCTIYNTSKAALRHFTKCAALELGPKEVRVNSIVPAGVKTEMCRSIGVTDLDAHNKRRAAQLPLKHMIECEEVAELIGFLASDKARSITGSEHVIDAGHLLGGETPKYN